MISAVLALLVADKAMHEGSQSPERLDAVLNEDEEELVDYDFEHEYELEHEDEPELEPIPESPGNGDLAEAADVDLGEADNATDATSLPDEGASPSAKSIPATAHMADAVDEDMQQASPEHPAHDAACQSETSTAKRAEKDAAPEDKDNVGQDAAREDKKGAEKDAAQIEKKRAAQRRLDGPLERRHQRTNDRPSQPAKREQSSAQPGSVQRSTKGNRYFLLKSISLENIEISVAEGIWATQVCSIFHWYLQPSTITLEDQLWARSAMHQPVH